MSNQWKIFADDEEVEIPKTTSNPVRKLKKKLRRKKEKFKINPSPELENEISVLLEKLSLYEKEKCYKPKPEKKKFKKQNVKKNKQTKFRKKKSVKKDYKWEEFIKKKEEELKYKREKHEKERRAKQRGTWRKEEEERWKKRQQKKKEYKLKQPIFPRRQLPVDIINWLMNPTRKVYYMLMKKYHPDKNNNKDNEYAKVVTSHWNTISISFN